MERVIEQNCEDKTKGNARQTFQRIKQCNGDIAMPTPHPCKTKAPEHINVYTDGSWLYPLKQFLGLGGAGVWWPNRRLSKNDEGIYPIPLSVAEQSMATHVTEEEGVRLYTKIGGFAGSSTRTELAAGIIAICAHGPVHIGSDSEVFVNGANRILAEIALHKPNKKKWND